MKHQKHPSGSYFGPKLRIPSRLKVGNGSVRKPRKPKSRFVSKPMKKILEEVKKGQANMQSIMGNGRKDIGAPNKAYAHTMVINNKSNYNERDRQGNYVSPQSKQHLLDSGEVGQRNVDVMKEDSPMAISLKSRHAFSSKKLVKPALESTSKMKHCANDAKMNLKAMPGLVLNSKRRLKLDNEPTAWMHKRDQMNGCNDITNDDNLRSRKELEEKPKSHDDNGSESENLNHRTMKPKGVVDDSTRLTPQDDILKDCHDRVSMPFVDNCLKEECYCCSKPIDEPIWRGLLRIGNKVITLSGHLSTKSCEKVRNLSKSLSRVVEVNKVPRSKVWPKRWEGTRPTNDNIGLYFFPHKMRPDKYHDQLLEEVMENDLALRAIIGDTEMLMFPSSLLPIRYQRFQMKLYFWGVFKPRELEGKQGAALHQPDHTTGATAFAANAATATGIATDAASIPLGAARVDDANIPTEATNAPTVTANHRQTNSSSMGAPPGRIPLGAPPSHNAFVVQQNPTPRLEQLIREMQHEGVLVMQGEMMSTRSWPGKVATVTQCGQPGKT